MIIKSINIISFGKLKNKKISFSDNLNVIYGRNESGKTTVSAFIEAMLYSFPPRTDRSKYLPWDNSTAAGEMTVSIDGKDTTIYRKFAPQPKGDVVEPKNFSFDGLIPPNRDSYRKSAYSPEGGMGNFGTTDDLDNIISNILSTGDENIGAQSAIKKLEKLRRTLNTGNKIKEYESKIFKLENEYSQANAATHQFERFKEAIEEKKSLIKFYEEKAETDKEAPNPYLRQLQDLDLQIKSQEDYLKTFPEETSPLPVKPPFLTKYALFYILCTAAVFIAGFFTHWALTLSSLIPLLAYLFSFLYKKANYNALLKSFLQSVYCSDEQEYLTLVKEKADAEDYYTILLKQKSDLVTKSASDMANSNDLIYKKLLTLKKELEELEESAKHPFREPFTIAQELDYYKNLHLELSQKLEAIKVAIDAINYARDIIATDFTPTVSNIAMSYLNRIAPKEGRFATLSRDMTLTVSDGVRQPLLSQSFGFREELYLCFRIAWSEFLFGKSFPLIIDDPFLGSDDYREEALIDLLHSISKDRQVIIFTNRKNNRYNQLNCNWVDIST